MLKGTLIFASVLALSAQAALAESVSVPAGETSAIIDFTNLDDACQTIGKPRGKVERQPKHGKVTFQWISLTLDEDYGSCKGKHAKALRVLYTPDSGYRGADSFKVGATMPAYEDGSGSRYYGDAFELTVE
ncbi:hypothetical protein [Gellertiella hungarica]|uniref:Uncharacterized protein n=1 Tax=Gellertiella hungarica TaxID=1572859 RepID=A0A7W6NJV7_9HYPH|nr:hypothetical protein [Gellertiella hungarica]MBB4064193.1 hypothetical protein [Gellertiella hungarica]